jgi:histidine triad (HIT) family protein
MPEAPKATVGLKEGNPMAGEPCVFCRIVSGELPARILHRDEWIVAFEDANPRAPTHVLLVPRTHVARAAEVTGEHAPALARIFEVAARIARERGIEDGYRLVVNNGPGAGQTIYHLHVHLLGGRALRWPPG